MICDTSGILSAYSADQPHHKASARILRETSRRLISPIVLTEVDYLVGRRLGQAVAVRIMQKLAGPEYQILPYTSEIMKIATDVMATYADLNLGIVDASLVAASFPSQKRPTLAL